MCRPGHAELHSEAHTRFMIPGKVYTHDELLRCAWRRRWAIVVPVVIAVAATGVLLVTLPDRYRAETLLQVVPQRVPSSYVKATVSSSIDDRLHALTQQILSRSKLERIIADFRLYPADRTRLPLEDVIENMRRDIVVQGIKSDSFRVAYVSDTPTLAKQVTDRLTALFINENLLERAGVAESTEQFIGTQLAQARERLVEHEQKLEAYRRQHVGELPSQVSGNIQSLQSLQLQAQALAESIARDTDRVAVLEKQARESADLPVGVAASGDSGADSATSGTLRQQLDAARAALQALSLRLKPTHPDVARQQRVVAGLEARLERAASEAPLGASATAVAVTLKAASELDAVRRRVLDKEQQQQRIRQEIGRYQARLDAAPTRESELTELTRDYDTLRALYTSLLVKSEDSKAAVSLEAGQVGEQFRVLDPARLPQRPFSPDRPMLAAVGLLAGLAAGLGLAALLEFRDGSLRTEGDVHLALGVRVVAAIPVMQTSAHARRHLRRALAVGTAGVVLVGGLSVMAWTLLR